MSLPLVVAGRTFHTAPELAQAVLLDVAAGGSTVVEGERPRRWLAREVREGRLDRAIAVGLCAALVRMGRPEGVVEAAKIAMALDLEELAELLPSALDALDIGVLLHPQPALDIASVEDALLEAWARLLPVDDADARDRLLVRLRNAGQRRLELAVLARCGDARSVRRVLPSVLSEGLSVEEAAVLGRLLAGQPEIAEATIDSSTALSDSQRYAIWQQALTWRPTLAAEHGRREAWLAPSGI